MGVESQFEDGLRVTDDAALEVALGVLRGVINAELVAALRGYGADAVGWSGVDGGTLRGRRVPGLGRVVTVDEVRTRAPGSCSWPAGALPVIAPIGAGHGRQSSATSTPMMPRPPLAGALGARLVLLTDSDGVWDADGQRIPR